MYTECMVEQSAGKARQGESEGVLWRSRSVSVCRVCERVLPNTTTLRYTRHDQTHRMQWPLQAAAPAINNNYFPLHGPDRTRPDPRGPARTLSETPHGPNGVSRRPGPQKSPCESGRARVVEFSYKRVSRLNRLAAIQLNRDQYNTISH